MTTTPSPTILGVLETVLYYRDQDRAARFYAEVLGMRLLDREPGRSLFFRAGDSVVLLFDAGATRQGDRLPAHGADGSIHVCFRVPPDQYETWKEHLAARDVAILDEIRWSRGLTFYFRDTEGNLLEIANADIWPE